MANSDLPGYAPERPLWQPPAVIPSGSVGELARAVQTALAGISGALQQLGGRRNVVPLQGNLDARDGQVIAGVASGQVITLPSPNLGQYGSVTVIVTAVSSAATVVSPDGSSYALDQTGVYEFAISPDDTAWRAPPWLSSTGAGFDWSTVLDKGASSGAHNPIIDAGQYIGFGDQSLIPPGGTNQIRAATDFGVRSEGNIALTSATTMQLRPLGSWLWCNPFDPFYVYTANTPQLEIGTDGTWYLGASFDSGSSGEVLTSQGAGSPPVWASVDLSSVTYTAGDGIDLASNVFSADVSDFAGTGLEDDGSNNLRIAAAAAGSGLTGGGGSALAVGAGDGITVNANDVAVKVSDIAGAGLEDDGSNNLRIAASAAGTGLSGGGGSPLAVNQATSFTWTGSHQYSNTLGFTTAGRVSQTLAANANNVDMSAANVLRLVANGFSLTGMVAGFSGQLVLIVNADSSDALNISHDSASSTAANRFFCPANTVYSVPARGCVWAYYDGPSSRWLLVAAPGNG
ncbi:MAG TPA: hypothetical protein VFM12_03615 [Gemmatimonadales bacterium]|nr:hypothetical protein [Gemmatimonadales bacterium]